MVPGEGSRPSTGHASYIKSGLTSSSISALLPTGQAQLRFENCKLRIVNGAWRGTSSRRFTPQDRLLVPSSLFEYILVPGEGLEPSLPKERDFKSLVYTNFTIQARRHFAPACVQCYSHCTPAYAGVSFSPEISPLHSDNFREPRWGPK